MKPMNPTIHLKIALFNDGEKDKPFHYITLEYKKTTSFIQVPFISSDYQSEIGRAFDEAKKHLLKLNAQTPEDKVGV